MNTNLDPFLEEVQRGREGLNVGLKGGFPKLDKATYGIQRKRIYLVGAEEKTGKTTWVNFRFVISPYLQGYKNIRWNYFSYEIDKIDTIAKLVACLMYIKYNRLVDENYILGRAEYRLSDDDTKMVEEIVSNDISAIMSNMLFIEKKMPPTAIKSTLIEDLKHYGRLEFEDDGQLKKFTPYKEDFHRISIFDHVGLIPIEPGKGNKKNSLDYFSSNLVEIRNKTNDIFVPISQFNRSLSNIERLKYSKDFLKPSPSDFKDTGNLSEDANMVIALFNPTLYPQIKDYLGYNPKDVGIGFRSLHILRNRNGRGQIDLPMKMIGENGFFEEL